VRWSVEVGEYVSALDAAAHGHAIIYGDGGGAVGLHDAECGEPLGAASSHATTVVAACLSADGRHWASASIDGAVQIGQVGGASSFVRRPGGEAAALAWSPGGDRLAAAVGRSVEVFSVEGARVAAVDGLPSTVAGVAWSSRGHTLAAACYGGVHLFAIGADAPARHLPWKGSLLGLGWSPDESVIAASSQDGSVHFWRLATGQDSEMRGYPFKPKHLAWSPDSRWLATSGAASVTVWSFTGGGPEGTAPRVLEGHRGLVSGLSFAPGGHVIASASEDTSILVWDLDRGDRPVRFAFLEEVPTALAWAAGGRTLVVAGDEGTLRAWEAPR
jgi:WD40 repeat protein